MTDRPLVIYHSPCADGHTAAWCAWRRFRDRADYLPAQHGDAPPDVSGRTVFILDFSYKRPVLERLLASCRSLTLLDHHKSAQADLAGLEAPNLTVVFDMAKSGARLAWEYFFPGEPSPWLVDYTEDRDLWRWALPDSRELSAWLGSLEWTFEAWDVIGEEPGNKLRESRVEQGAAILRYQARQVEFLCSQAREVEIAGHRVLAANTPVLVSEVAGRLAEGRPFGAAWSVRGDGLTAWSLRSREGGVDVSEVARLYGGGGHARAAGYEVPPGGGRQGKE